MDAVLVVAVSSILILVPTFLNGFPFLFPDSADYLVFTPRIYRSPFYGLLIFFFHMNRWIWLPVVMQAAVVSHLLWVMSRLSGTGSPAGTAVLTSALLSLCSSLPFFAGFIMADLFTPVMVVTMYVVGFHYCALTPALKGYLLLLLCVATAAHVSNLSLAAGLLAAFAMLFRWCGRSYAQILGRLGLLLIPVGLTTSAILSFNALIFSSASLVPAGSTFLMANMIQYGPARAYLEDACPDAGYRLCGYVDRLPRTADELLWSSGIFDELGGFVGMKSEASEIVAETIAQHPAAVVRMIARNFVAGLFLHEPAAEFSPDLQVPSMIELFGIKFGPHAISDYLGSAEMRGSIPHDLIRQVDAVVVPMMFFALIGLFVLAALRGYMDDAAFAAFILAAVLGNTLLCTAVSGVHDRYQARMTWLLPMAVVFTAIRVKTRADAGTAMIRHRPACGQ